MNAFALLEHAIRRIFVCVNGTEERLLLAEKHSLYTSIDVLLAPGPTTFFDRNNLIIAELGDRAVNLLYDLLLWEHCPRVRDLIVHGGVQRPLAMSPVIADRVVCLALFLATKYDVLHNKHQQFEDEYVQSLPKPVQQAIRFIEQQYEPLFHPRNLVLRAMEQGFASLMQLQLTAKLSYFESEIGDDL
jgi:hypothetical protein